MKKIAKKITSGVILTSMILLNISVSTAEWKHIETKFSTINPLLMTEKQKNARKDEQLCKIATSFDILNDDGTVKYTYYPQGCQKKEEKTSSGTFEKSSMKEDQNSNLDEESVNAFINNIFGIEKDKEEVQSSTWMIESTQTGQIDNSQTTSSGDIENDPDVKDLFKFLEWKLDTKDNLALKGHKMAKTIKDYSKQKIRIRVGKVEANALSSDMAYTQKVAALLKWVDRDFHLDFVKNDYAKNISDLSYSLYTYKNTKDPETKKVFKNQLIKDVKKLKRKYKILKFKDLLIYKTLQLRWEI